uniref:Zinc finger, HIT-type containing 2 n=1 Tax=Labrus bergylta TaxID=56723 RepID=A0A3Q3GD96_9LABR
MNPLIRRRLPPSVRSLLTDLSPKQQWTDTEPDTQPDTVTTDGIHLPSRGTALQEEFLTPAKTQDEEEAAANDVKAGKSAVCMLCKCKTSCYTCPRCNTHYCSLACYQSPDHSACSEEFYKESVLRELKDMGKTESEGRKKMQDVLVGLRQKAEGTDGGMETLLKEAGVVSDDGGDCEGEVMEKVLVVELLSRLAELQQSGVGSETEIEAILRKLEEIGGGDLLPEHVDKDTVGAEEEELWELLNSKDKEAFMGMMKSGAFGGLVPLWIPWWEEHEEGARGLVEELELEEEGREKGKDTSKDKRGSTVPYIPPISAKIPKLSSLCICDMILALSEALNSNRVFNSVHEALECGETLILDGGYLDKEDPVAPTRAMEAVAHIMTGRDRKDATGYCLAALSQLRSVLSRARSMLSKEGDDGKRRQKYFLSSKKCEFFQAWVLDNEHRTRTLAIELWNEHSRRESVRSSMEKAKTVVEQNLKKRKSKGKHSLIEELR